MPADFYTRTMYKKYHYFATWEPGRGMKLGDIGVMDGHDFNYISNLKHLGISFEAETDDSLGNLEFISDKEVKFHTKLKGEAKLEEYHIGKTDAGVLIEFNADKSILFKIEGAKTHYISDQVALAKEIERRYNHLQGDEKWEKDWVVITELIEGAAGTVIVSIGRGAKIALKVKGDVDMEKVVVANAKADIGAAYSQAIGAKAINKAGITPLFKLKGIRQGWFSKEGKFKKKGEVEPEEELVQREAFLEIEPE